ncbi:autophagy-related protein, partial [Chytriomyces cf. hyalinus JEL632]
MHFELSLNIDRYYLTAALRAIVHSIFFQRSFTLTRPVEVVLDFLDLTYVRVDDPEMERFMDERISQFTKSLDSMNLPSSSPASANPLNDPKSSSSSRASSAASSLKSVSSASNLASMAAAAAVGFGRSVVGGESSSGAGNSFGGRTGASGAGQQGDLAFVVSFSERRAKKTGAWFSNEPNSAPWETWTIRLRVTQSRTEREQIQAKKLVEQQLLATLFKIAQYSNENKDYVPAITAQEGYPFPVQISFTNSEQSWGGILKSFIS